MTVRLTNVLTTWHWAASCLHGSRPPSIDTTGHGAAGWNCTSTYSELYLCYSTTDTTGTTDATGSTDTTVSTGPIGSAGSSDITNSTGTTSITGTTYTTGIARSRDIMFWTLCSSLVSFVCATTKSAFLPLWLFLQHIRLSSGWPV